MRRGFAPVFVNCKTSVIEMILSTICESHFIWNYMNTYVLLHLPETDHLEQVDD